LAVCLIASAGFAGCGGDSANLAPIRLTHQPPIGQLTAEQLRSLAMDCEKYPRKGAARGRYEAAYCDDASAAWSDAPLQMLPMAPAGQPSDRRSID
jgi:hypothetical protein